MARRRETRERERDFAATAATTPNSQQQINVFPYAVHASCHRSNRNIAGR
jgi:hypothetical protein